RHTNRCPPRSACRRTRAGNREAANRCRTAEPKALRLSQALARGDRAGPSPFFDRAKDRWRATTSWRASRPKSKRRQRLRQSARCVSCFLSRLKAVFFQAPEQDVEPVLPEEGFALECRGRHAPMAAVGVSLLIGLDDGFVFVGIGGDLRIERREVEARALR